MIDFLRNWVVNIVTIVIFIVLLEILIPSGRIRKFVNLFSSFILIIAIMNPFLGLIKKGVDLKGLQISDSDFLDKKQIEQDSKVLNQRQMTEITETYRAKLIGQLEESAKEVKGVKNVTADVIIDEDYTKDSFGQIKRVYLTLDNNDENTTIDPIVEIKKVEIGNVNEKTDLTKTPEVDAKIKKQLEDKISAIYQLKKEDIIVQLKNEGGVNDGGN